MEIERWYVRYAWVWFALVGLVGLLVGLVVLVNPSAGIDVFAQFGPVLPPAIAADPAAIAYVEFISHWSATATVGVDLFGLCIAATAFRRGERWAWMVSWYWPVLFSIHFLTYETGFRYAQLFWMAGSLAALAVTYPRVRAGAPRAAEPVPAP